MGTTCMYREKGISSRDFFIREFRFESANDTSDNKMLKSAMIYGIFYAAIHNSKTNETFCLVVKTSNHPKDYYNFCFKEMTDDMGPCFYDCPLRILDLLSPTDSEWANEWRKKCRANAMKPKLKPGDRVKFANPVHFSNGEDISTFYYERGNKFTILPGGYGTYHITNWKRLDYEVLAH